MADLNELKQRVDFLASERTTWEAHWQELVDYLAPHRQSFTTTRTPGEKSMSRIYDATPILAAYLFGQGIYGLMCNAATRWFGVSAEREDLNDINAVKLWLEMVEQLFYAVFNKSNFYSEIQGYLQDWGTFSTAVQYVGEHPRTMVYFRTLHLGQCYVAEDQRGKVDSLYRKYRMTARQMQQQWGEGVSTEVNKCLKTNPEEKFEVIHAVYPRDLAPSGKKDNRAFPWASVYFESDKLHLLNESGYREFPYLVSRWSPAAEEKFGRGPGTIALPDVKMLNRMEYDILRAGSKRVDPPLLVSNDALINPLRLSPGGVNILSADNVRDKFAFFQSPGNLGYSEEKTEQKRKQIREIFFNDMLELAGGPDMTAFEVAQRLERKMRLLGGSFGQLQTDYLTPLFDRIFSMMPEGGHLPPPPREMQGEALKIDYLSPLARAQRSSENQGITVAAGFMGQIAKFYPPVLDVADWDEAARHIMENYNVPAKIILPADKVAKLRQMRAKQQQAQQMAEMVLKGAQTIPALSKGPEPGSPMDQLSQQFQQGAGNA